MFGGEQFIGNGNDEDHSNPRLGTDWAFTNSENGSLTIS